MACVESTHTNMRTTYRVTICLVLVLLAHGQQYVALTPKPQLSGTTQVGFRNREMGLHSAVENCIVTRMHCVLLDLVEVLRTLIVAFEPHGVQYLGCDVYMLPLPPR